MKIMYKQYKERETWMDVMMTNRKILLCTFFSDKICNTQNNDIIKSAVFNKKITICFETMNFFIVEVENNLQKLNFNVTCEN